MDECRFNIPKCNQYSKMYLIFQYAISMDKCLFHIPKCIQYSKMHSIFQNVFNIPKCNINGQMPI